MKICENCKKPMEYRKKWRNNWDDVKYCSEKCRRNKTPKISTDK
ncbi:MAG: DUF2256 domain-containing protein [Bdellovibrionales bacterium]